MALDFGKLNFSTSFNPTSAFPLDARSYFESLTAAQTAVNSAEEAGSSSTVYFFGEEIIVVENDIATVYVIEKVIDTSEKGYHGGLKEVGSKTLGDGSSIDLTDGVLSIHNFSGASTSQVAYKDANGKIAWATVDTLVTVDGKSIIKGTNGLEVKIDAAGGLNVDQTNGLEIKVKQNGGLATDSNGAYVDTNIIATKQSVTDEATTRAAADSALDVRVSNLEARGRYLSTWDCATGLPGDYPEVPSTETGLSYTYTFKTGDYYIVNNLPTTGTKYMPNGASITATRTTVSDPWVWTIGKTEYTGTGTLVVGGQFVYSTSSWTYVATAKDVTFANVAGSPYDNTQLASALNSKQDKLVAGNNIQIAADGKTISATDTTYSEGDGIDITGTTIAVDDTVVRTSEDQNINGTKTFNNKTVFSGSGMRVGVYDATIEAEGQHLTVRTPFDKGSAYSPEQPANLTLRAEGKAYYKKDKTAAVTADDEIATVKNVADHHDSTKQDTLTAGTNIQINNNVISATDTTYTAGKGIDITDNAIGIADGWTPGSALILNGGNAGLTD